MKIIVTGGCGFIGSNLVRLLLLEKGEQVINIDKLTYAGNASSLEDVADHPNYVFEAVDICDPLELRRVFTRHKPDAVMHLAAESHVDRSIDGPGEFIQTNIHGTYNLLQTSLEYWRSLPQADPDSARQVAKGASDAVRLESDNPRNSNHTPSQSSFRFLHVSTDEVYGSLTSAAPAFHEKTPYDPHSPYSASKAASDHLVRAWGDTYGLPVLVTNCSNNYGPFQFPEKLIPVVILKCLRGEPIPVYGKGENIRDWLYVEDHAEALHAVLTRGRVGETYNIGGDNEQRNIDLVRMLCQLMAGEVAPPGHKSYEDLITFVTDRPGHDLRYAIDAGKIRGELGWKPRETFESGFRKTVQWYLGNREWWEAILSGDYKLERLGEG